MLCSKTADAAAVAAVSRRLRRWCDELVPLDWLTAAVASVSRRLRRWSLRRAYACAERPLGKGHLVICQVDLAMRTATNPAARTLADALLG